MVLVSTAFKIVVEKVVVRNGLGYLGVVGRNILKWNFSKVWKFGLNSPL